MLLPIPLHGRLRNLAALFISGLGRHEPWVERNPVLPSGKDIGVPADIAHGTDRDIAAFQSPRQSITFPDVSDMQPMWNKGLLHPVEFFFETD